MKEPILAAEFLETLPLPQLTGEYILDNILIDYFKQRQPIRIIQRKSFEKNFVGELIYDSILESYYKDLEMDKNAEPAYESGVVSEKAIPKDTQTKTAYSSSQNVELLILLSDDLDIERKRSQYGYYFVFTRYTRSGEVRSVNVPYGYVKSLSEMQQQISDAVKDRVEREFPMKRTNHGLGIIEFRKYWYVSMPFYNKDKTVNYQKTINLHEAEWLNLRESFKTLLVEDQNAGYITKRKIRTMPPGVVVIDKRRKPNAPQTTPDGDTEKQNREETAIEPMSTSSEENTTGEKPLSLSTSIEENTKDTSETSSTTTEEIITSTTEEITETTTETTEITATEE